MMDYAGFLFSIMLALTCLYWWARDREKETQRRYDDCLHPPEKQVILRIGREHPMLGGRKLPGFRWAKKHCEACGWQRSLYAPSTKPWQEYQDEFDQETLDRKVEYASRLKQHEQEEAHNERLRLLKRQKGLEQHEHRADS